MGVPVTAAFPKPNIDTECGTNEENMLLGKHRV
jgi:hypothetical protein